jgi:AcrR family transcriptional regulator
MSAVARLQPSERRALIVEAATRLLAEHSFADITIDMLRDEAGLSKGGLYHHVKSKSEILVLVCEEAARSMVEALETAEQHEGTARERVELLMRVQLEVVFRYGGALWAFFSERSRLTAQERERVIALERRFVRGVKALFDDMKASGELRDVDTLTLTHAFIGMINWVARWYRGKPAIQGLSDTLATLFLDGSFRSAPE